MANPISQRSSPPPARATAPSGWLAAQGRLPLAFMGLALAWLVVATGLLVFNPQLLLFPHVHPQVIALTHAWILGFFVTVACGAVYQLAPVALSTTLVSERYGWWHFGLHAAGVPGMVWSFWIWDLKLLGHFGFIVALGILLFSVNTWRTVRRSERRGPVSWSLILAAGWLLATVLVGLLLAANRHWGFIPLNPVVLLRAHAHLGLVGFFLNLLQGVGFQLVPMFTLGEVRDWRLAKIGLGLTQVGLLALVPAYLWQIMPLAVTAALAITVGIICSGTGLWRSLATRKKRALDPGVRAFLRGGVGVGVAAFAGMLILFQGPGGGTTGGFHTMFYAVLVIFGGLLPCIAGMMCKIVPFLTWMRAYGPRVGRGGPTPSASTLASPRMERAGLVFQGFAVVPLLAGVWLPSVTLVTVGVGVLAVGVVLFTADMLGVLRHLWIVPTAVAKPKEIKI